jgi:7-carboxy-7-deazaguanine synthase
VSRIYAVKEIYYTLQGEGANAGRPAVFCRFAGCNLWSGRDEDRSKAACTFCDTDFVGIDGPGGGRFRSAAELSLAIAAKWPATPSERGNRLVVFTGGEPLLQLDGPVTGALHEEGFEVAVETNGTLPAPAGIDWICVSPKGTTELVVRSGNELKLVFPQAAAPPERFEAFPFDRYYLQPMDGAARVENTERALRYCLEHPQWRLSLQTHKYVGIP